MFGCFFVNLSAGTAVVLDYQKTNDNAEEYSAHSAHGCAYPHIASQKTDNDAQNKADGEGKKIILKMAHYFASY